MIIELGRAMINRVLMVMLILDRRLLSRAMVVVKGGDGAWANQKRSAQGFANALRVAGRWRETV